MFLGLRSMANLPLESFKYGGLLWFTDITMPDQFFILPVVTVITLGVTLEVVFILISNKKYLYFIKIFFFYVAWSRLW